MFTLMHSALILVSTSVASDEEEEEEEGEMGLVKYTWSLVYPDRLMS